MIKLRKNQHPPKKNWRFWSIVAGRGFGKTLAGAHAIMDFIRKKEKKAIGLIGHTLADIKNIMVYGPSGILPLAHQYVIPFSIHWLENKIKFFDDIFVYIFSGDHYDKLRGFQLDCVWVDELAKFRDPQQLINQIIFATRLGHPQFIITTTPRPLSVFQFLQQQKQSFMTTGSSYENKHLPATYIQLINQWSHTPMGQQEIFGKILKTSSSPWHQYQFIYGCANDLSNYVLSIDPSVTSQGHTTGIILGAHCRHNDTLVVVDDFSMQTSVENWINYVIKILNNYKFIKHLIIETNQGGDLLTYTIEKSIDRPIHIHKVFATHDKYSRSLSTAQLYWKNSIIHQKPLPLLEEELLNFTGTLDRVDALVWAVEFLIKNKSIPAFALGFWYC